MNARCSLRRICIATACALSAPALADAHIALQNSHVLRLFDNQDGAWRTQSISRASGTDRIYIRSDEFLIRLMDGTELTASDFDCPERPVIETAGGVQTFVVRYVGKKDRAPHTPTLVDVEHFLADEPYLRKRIRVTMPAGGTIDRLEVERFTTTVPCDRGGRGEPVFIGKSWFVGLEYPGAETKHDNGRVTLAHFPGRGRPTGDGGTYIVESKTAVVGVGAKDDPLELAFADYLETIRRPNRIMLHYNSWYDFRNNELTRKALVDTYKAFKKNVLDPYDLKMDVFVPDDGWQDPKSIWVPRKNLYPKGFGSLAKALERRGSRLGLWMPFNGFNLDVNWGAARGYEKSDKGRYYCLTAPTYNAEIRKVTERLIKQGNIGYFKHDFNQLRCTADGHGHLPDDRHGHEANLDAELELLAFERSLQTDIYLNVTSYVWHSPWWLMHADSIWMAAGDFGYNRDWPQLSPREWAMSYRDAHFHKLFQERGVLVPLSAMMTHGIIHGRYQKLGGDDETLREWSDYVVMYYGRGVQLMEWYITPEMMSPERWEILGRATRWAIQNKDVLQNVVMVGGDPRKGEPYGYAHWTADRGIVVLRNPDVREQSIEVPFDKSVLYRAATGRPFRGRVIYPYVEDMPAQFTSGSPMKIKIPGASVLVCEFTPGKAAKVASPRTFKPIGGDGNLLHAKDSRLFVATLAVPDEAMSRCDLFIINRNGDGRLFQGDPQVNGDSVAVRIAKGSDWSAYGIDLLPFRGQSTTVGCPLVLFAEDEQRPFGRPDWQIDAWLVVDRPVDAKGGSLNDLPFPISQRHRRRTEHVASDVYRESRIERRFIRPLDPKKIRAAKLRIVVFDSNSEPRYRDKFIMLNGKKLARVPANGHPLSAWKEHIIDLTPEQVLWLRPVNRVQVTNDCGDYFKFRGVALSALSNGGTWVESTTDPDVHSSVSDWSYAEGRPFENNRSGVIRLSFE